MDRRQRAAEFLKEAESFLKQAQTGTQGVQIKSVSPDGVRIAGFPVALRTIGDDTVVVRADIQLSLTDVRRSNSFVMGVRVEMEKEQPDENRLKNAFMFYRDKVPPQIFRAVTSALVTGGLDKVVW
jgi:hypothetical protein